MLAIFAFGFDLRGASIFENFHEETLHIFNNPQLLVLITSNVLAAILISYAINNTKKNMNFFKDSPYEKILSTLTLTEPHPRQFIRTALRSLITKKRFEIFLTKFSVFKLKIKKTYRSH